MDAGCDRSRLFACCEVRFLGLFCNQIKAHVPLASRFSVFSLPFRTARRSDDRNLKDSHRSRSGWWTRYPRSYARTPPHSTAANEPARAWCACCGWVGARLRSSSRANHPFDWIGVEGFGGVLIIVRCRCANAPSTFLSPCFPKPRRARLLLKFRTISMTPRKKNKRGGGLYGPRSNVRARREEAP